jgi:hypothetical protein
MAGLVMHERLPGFLARFVALSFGVTAALILVGYPATIRIGGPEAVSGLFIGCGISLVASWIGAVPLGLMTRRPGTDQAAAVLGASVLRFFVVLGLALLAVAGGWCHRASLLIWVAASYMVLLVVDTFYAVKATRAVRGSSK